MKQLKGWVIIGSLVLGSVVVVNVMAQGEPPRRPLDSPVSPISPEPTPTPVVNIYLPVVQKEE